MLAGMSEHEIGANSEESEWRCVGDMIPGLSYRPANFPSADSIRGFQVHPEILEAVAEIAALSDGPGIELSHLEWMLSTG